MATFALKWTKLKRAQLAGSRAPHHLDEPLPSVHHDWNALRERINPALTARGAWKPHFAAALKLLTKSTPPHQQLAPEVEWSMVASAVASHTSTVEPRLGVDAATRLLLRRAGPTGWFEVMALQPPLEFDGSAFVPAEKVEGFVRGFNLSTQVLAAARRWHLSRDARQQARNLAALRPILVKREKKLPAVAKELKSFNPSNDELLYGPPHERHWLHVLAYVFGDTTLNERLATELVDAVQTLGLKPRGLPKPWPKPTADQLASGKLFTWINRVDATLLLPGITSPDLAQSLAKVFQPNAHVASQHAFDIVEALGVNAGPTLKSLHAGLKHSTQERKHVEQAMAVLGAKP